ncbi:MAG: hypothetical protein OSA84_09930 [Akkermansiaceae bacterium]|nr:hypothetical protein [Akkermansiaceae bacterium]
MTTSITYDDKTVRRFMTASIFWGVVGMLVGLLAATQLSWWQMNGKFLETITFGLFKGEGLAYITFGRMVAESKLPVVPCRLEGCFRAWPPGGSFVKLTRLSIKIGKPITFEDCPDNRSGWNTVAGRLHECLENLAD